MTWMTNSAPTRSSQTSASRHRAIGAELDVLLPGLRPWRTASVTLSRHHWALFSEIWCTRPRWVWSTEAWFVCPRSFSLHRSLCVHAGDKLMDYRFLSTAADSAAA